MANLTEISNWDTGIYRIETTDPVLGGEDGIANKAAKNLANRTRYLKEQHEALAEEVILLDSGKANRTIIVPYVETVPLTNIGDIIFLKGFGEMWWTNTAYFTGYRSPRCGDLVFGTTVAPKPYEIDLVGGVYDRAAHWRFNALYQWAKENNHFVPAVNWKAGPLNFADISGTTFRVPDLQNQFPRFTGINADNANARVLGSYQADAAQKITGQFMFRSTNQSASLFPVGTTSGSFRVGPAEGQQGGIVNVETTAKAMDLLTFDSSRVARTATETRGQNTAFAPRIIAY